MIWILMRNYRRLNMYKLINEDNTWVNEYPSNEIASLINEEDKENMILFKEEIEKITIPEGLGKITVEVIFEGTIMENEFVIKNRKNQSFEERDRLIRKILDHLTKFAKTEDLFKFFKNCYIVFI